LAGTKLDLIRQRIQQQTLHRRGHTGDPLYRLVRESRVTGQGEAIRRKPDLIVGWF